MEERDNPRCEYVGLGDYQAVLVRRKRLIGVIVGAAFVSSIVVGLLLPKQYSATARVLPPAPDDPGAASSLLSRAPGGLGGMAACLLGASSSSEVWAEILRSDTVRDAVIRRLSLMDAFKTRVMDDARRELSSHTRIIRSKAGVLSITVEDGSPQRAADIANALVEELDRFNKGHAMTEGAQRRIFIEGRMAETKAKLTSDEEALKRFQASYGVVSMDSQETAEIDSLGKARGELMNREAELRSMLSYAMPDNPQVKMLKAGVEGLRGELGRLGRGGSGGTGAKNDDIFIPTSEFPGLSEGYTRIRRDLKIQEALYGFLASEYEQARIQEARDYPVVQVLDWASVPQRRSRPRRLQIAILTTSTAAILAVFLAFILERPSSGLRTGLQRPD